MKDKQEPAFIIVRDMDAAERYQGSRLHDIQVDPCMLDNYMTSDEITEVMEAGATPTEEL